MFVPRVRYLFWTLVILCCLLWLPREAVAGWQDDENESTYIEIWIDHDEFTGGCESPAKYYIEPCFGEDNAKVLDFRLPNLSKVTQIFVNFDQWNLRRPENLRFRINAGAEQRSDIAAPYSRTQYLKEQTKDQFNSNTTNSIKFWSQGAVYHVRDVSFRLYYAPGNPPLAGLGTLAANLASVGNGSVTHASGDGGALNVDGDALVFTVNNVSANVDFVEIYAYYDGYDEDNRNGTKDWHSRAHQNCHQGGVANECKSGDPETGFTGTIDHVGTIDTTSNASSYSYTWDVSLLEAQEGVKFKLRAVDIDVDLNGDGNVNGADNAENVYNGPVSAPFSLTRNKAVVAFTVPNFEPAYIFQPDPSVADEHPRCRNTTTTTTAYTMTLPSDAGTFDEAILVASHWNNPLVALNGNANRSAFASQQTLLSFLDFYPLAQLRKPKLDVNWLQPGENQLTYTSQRKCPQGEFIEAPGPMLVLKRTTSPGNDTLAPWAHNNYPAVGASDQPTSTPISVEIYDSNSGVDLSTVRIRVDEGSGFVDVTNQVDVTGSKFNYVLLYRPAGGLEDGGNITVKIEAKDLAGNTMSPFIWTFAMTGQATYTVSVNAVDKNGLPTNNGAVTKSPDSAAYQLNANVTLSATPVNGWAFSGWSGDLTGSTNPVQIVVNANKIINAVFKQIFTLNVTKSPVDGGAVTAGPNRSTFVDGESVTLTAVAADGYEFVGWSGDATGTDPTLNVTMDGNKSIVANFGGNYTLTLLADGAGEIDHTPVQDSYDAGTQVTLTATPTAGNGFAGWDLNGDDAVDVTDAVTVIAMDGDKVVKAFFRPLYTLTTTSDPVEGGVISADVTGPQYLAGAVVQLTADPNEGYAFTGWAGDAAGDTPTVAVTMDGDKSVRATFAHAYQLTITQEGTGQVTADPALDAYVEGAQVQLSATPGDGFGFAGWDLDQDDVIDATEATLTLTMTEDQQVKAFFRILYSLSLTGVNGSIDAVPAKSAYMQGETVQLIPHPAAGFAFVAWTGDLSGNAQPGDLLFAGDDLTKEVGAVFDVGYGITILTPIGAGSVTLDPVVQPYPFGQSVTITATPDPGWAFVRWEKPVQSVMNPTTIVMNDNNLVNGNKEVQAVFEAVEYTVNVTVDTTSGAAGGRVDVSPPGPYLLNQQVTLTAVADQGWHFAGWSGDATGAEPSITLTIDGNKNVQAHFERDDLNMIFLPFVRHSQ